jgi:hypothetical protein
MHVMISNLIPIILLEYYGILHSAYFSFVFGYSGFSIKISKVHCPINATMCKRICNHYEQDRL